MFVVRVAGKPFIEKAQGMGRGHVIVLDDDEPLMPSEHLGQPVDDGGCAAHIVRPFHHFKPRKARDGAGQSAHGPRAGLVSFMTGAVAKDGQRR